MLTLPGVQGAPFRQAHEGRKEPALVQGSSIKLQSGSQLTFSKRELDPWPHLPITCLGREQSVPTDFNDEGKRTFNILPPCPRAPMEMPEISSGPQHLPKQIESIYYCQNVYFLFCLHLENCGLRQIVIASK